ncbi:MAG: hypothetical protein NVS4B8_20780 [Herpetosiphon sp.]
MQRKKLIPAAALAAGLVLGAAAGPGFHSTQVSAQTQPAAKTGTLQSLFFDKLATALHIQRPALDTAISTASKDAAAAAVQQGTLTQAQADALNQRVQGGDLGVLLDEHEGKGGFPMMGAVQQAMVDAAAKTLGITSSELRTQLQSGQTIAQLAQSHNTTEQAVTTAALAAAKGQLDATVKAGTITQAQADAIYSRLQQRGANLFSRHGRGHGRGQGLPGQSVTPKAPSVAPVTSGA